MLTVSHNIQRKSTVHKLCQCIDSLTSFLRPYSRCVKFSEGWFCSNVALYNCDKGKITKLNNLFASDYSGLVNVLEREVSNMQRCWRQQIPSALLCDRPSWSLLASLSSQRRTHLRARPCHILLPTCFRTCLTSSTGHVMECDTLSNPH